MLLMFPEQAKSQYHSEEYILDKFIGLKGDLIEILDGMTKAFPKSASEVTDAFFEQIPNVYEKLCSDMQAILDGDPAATCEYEVIRAYPGFYAIVFYRLAHELFKLGVPIVPRIITEYAHSKTGIDIHPGAEIGNSFFIDHGTGIVIGETTVIGENVKLYQGVTLGALSVSKDMAKTKRHPTIEDGAVIYAGATILGGETVIGKNCVVGGNVWLTRSITSKTRVYHQAQVKVQEPNDDVNA
jgi:serine O-acetyltransferase